MEFIRFNRIVLSRFLQYLSKNSWLDLISRYFTFTIKEKFHKLFRMWICTVLPKRCAVFFTSSTWSLTFAVTLFVASPFP
jgi:hypothetical protein